MSFKVAHVNVRSLTANFNQTKQLILNEKYDIIGISETWLHRGIDDGAVKIEGYSLIRNDRTGKRGGGVCFYIKNNLKFNVIVCEQSDFLEHIWIEFNLHKKIYIFGNIYRPPNNGCARFLNELEDTLIRIFSEYDSILCMGDMNINLLDYDSSNTSDLLSVFNTFSLEQIIKEPTRISGNSMTLIDLISTNIEVCDSGVVDVNIADHFLVFCKLALNNTNNPAKMISYRNLKNINLANFERDLEAIPWDNLYTIDDIDDKISFFNNNILQIFDVHAPLKTIRISNKTRYSPWITDNIKFMQKLRDKALKRYKKTKQPGHWEYYKQLRNLTSSTIHREKSVYLSQKLGNCNVKDKWKELRKLNIVKSRNREIPDHLNDVNMLNNYFVTSAKSALKPSGEIRNFYLDNRKNDVTETFSFVPSTVAEVLTIIQNLKSKAFGSDQLNITLIFLCCPFIGNYITHIINECITKSYFPRCWKFAYVVPIPKVSQPTELKHFRSVSILPTLSKILEKILESQIRSHTDKFLILPKNQSGFRSGYSCGTALASVTDDIFFSLDSNNLCALILLDYSKAFDILNHDLLIAILHFIGFGDSACSFMTSYLTERYQQVSLNNCTSNVELIDQGVPQGSILGPLLYTIYTCNFYNYLEHCNYHLYADDTQLYFSFPLSELDEANGKINQDLNTILNVSNNHALKINADKSCAVLFGSENQRRVALEILKIQFGNDTIPFSDSCKSLGLIIDYKLRFKEHVTYMLRKAYTSLKLVYSQRHCLTKDIKKLLCDSLVLSHFNYCDTVYGPCLDSMDAKRIQKTQNSCLRLIFGIKRSERISHKLRDAHWLNMYNRRKLHATCFFFKILKYRTPAYLHSRLSYRTDIHNLNLRRQGTLTIPRHKKEIFKRSFSYCIATCVGVMDVSSFSMSFNSFKTRYKRFLYNSQ